VETEVQTEEGDWIPFEAWETMCWQLADVYNLRGMTIALSILGAPIAQKVRRARYKLTSNEKVLWCYAENAPCRWPTHFVRLMPLILPASQNNSISTRKTLQGELVTYDWVHGQPSKSLPL
jgi:hypothetical protein